MLRFVTILLFFVFLLTMGAMRVDALSPLSGRIVLQVEENGEAWYIYPLNNRRYYLGRPADAFAIMRKFSLGAKHDYIINTVSFPDRLLGRILLDVEENGEAYYIDPIKRDKHYLARPADAFRIMREMGLGISNVDLQKIVMGDVDEPVTHENIDMKVPFVSQAPFGDWSDPRQQDGCEEASALMAVSYFRNESLSKSRALEEILSISDYLLDKYGVYRDVSSRDAVKWIYKDYLDYDNVEFKEDVSLDSIIDELEKGNLVVAAMNGQALKNPYFTPPGPIRHMLLIRGYDYDKQEFITNDPGTRHGEGFRYGRELLYNAIRDYPSGYHEPIERVEKNIIVVYPR